MSKILYDQYECPTCGEINTVDSDSWPERACDSMTVECHNCGEEVSVGWVAELEIRT